MMTKRPTKLISMIILAAGIILIAVSVDYSDEIIALIGLTLLLWGAILIYSSPEKYIHSKIFVHSADKIDKLYEAIMSSRNLEGPPTYYSPDNIWGLSNVILFIGKKDAFELYELTERNEFEITEEHLFIMPPGMALSDLIEEELNTNAASMELSSFNAAIKKAVVNQLELAEEVDIQINEKYFEIKIVKSLVNYLNEDYFANHETAKLVGDPLLSAIICLLAKVSHKPLMIENINYNSTLKVLQSKVQIL